MNIRRKLNFGFVLTMTVYATAGYYLKDTKLFYIVLFCIIVDIITFIYSFKKVR